MKNYLFVGGDERQKFAAEYIKKQVNDSTTKTSTCFFAP